MKEIGIFEAKTKLSEICEEVANAHVSVIITRRGTPLVYLQPIMEKKLTIKERRAAYMNEYGETEGNDSPDFEPAPRSREQSTFSIEE